MKVSIVKSVGSEDMSMKVEPQKRKRELLEVPVLSLIGTGVLSSSLAGVCSMIYYLQVVQKYKSCAKDCKDSIGPMF